MALTDTAIRKAARPAQPRKMTDGGGLYLLLRPNGAKYWRFDYRHAGKRNTISLGTYPDVALAAARTKRDKAREQVAAGSNPSTVRKAERREARAAKANTFSAVAREWLGNQEARLAPATFAKHTWMLEAFLLPKLGTTPMREIEPPVLLDAFQAVERKGRNETAHRVKQLCSQVFRYAVATGRATRDLTADLRGALKPVVSTGRAAVTTPSKIGALLRGIDAFEGSFVVLSALRLAPLVFVRPGELRRAEWNEIDLDGAMWRIPAAKMKMRDEHLVPLSAQAVIIFRELRPLTGAGRFVFPSNRTSLRPMSENTINAALRRLGYEQNEMTAHGFRAMASTRMNELGWRSDVIERQLAHAERNKVRAAYNRAQHLPDRKQLMQDWADELDRLRVTIIPARLAG
jgi:integrase